MATRPLPTANDAYVPTGKQGPILRGARSEISLLVASENVSLTYASRAAGERVADAHVHQHPEAFYTDGGLPADHAIMSPPSLGGLGRAQLLVRPSF